MIGVKNDNLDALILLSAQVLEESNLRCFAAADTADTVRPASLDRKVRRLIRQEQHARRTSAGWMSVKRVVAAILIFCTVAFAAAMSIEAVRGAVWQAIVRWYDTYIAVSFEDADAVPKTIRAKREPTDVPDAWVKEVSVDSQSLYRVVYTEKGEKMLIYKQQPLENQVWANNVESTVSETTVGDQTATLVVLKDTKHYTLYWSDGKYNYVLQAVSDEITPALMVQIAASVK